MKIGKVECWGLLLTEDAIDTITNFLSEKEIKCVGPFQNNMHYTIRYYGWRADTDRSDIAVSLLGKTVELTVDSFGYYIVDGIIQNMGFRIAADCLRDISVGNRTLAEISANTVPHITVAINHEKDADGKPIAKAVNTRFCDFSQLLEKPLAIPATFAVFRGDKVTFQIY